MKSIASLLLAACLAIGAVLTAGAQTNTPPATNTVTTTLTNALSTAGLGSNGVAAVNAIVSSLVDTAPYVKNGNILIEGGVLKLGSKYGGFLDVQFPVNTNSWQMTYGTSIAYLSNQVFSATLNVTLGTTVNIPVVTNLPVIGAFIQPLYAFVESGPDYNFSKNQVGAQYMGGFKYLQPIGKWGVGGSYAIGGESSFAQKIQEFSLFFTAPL